MEYVACDLKTTGDLSGPGGDAIVEIGAVRFDDTGAVLGTFESLVRPGRPCSPGAFAAHGLTDDELDLAPELSEVLPEFLEFIGDPEATTLLAHDARSQLGFLRSSTEELALPEVANPVVCTKDMARSKLPGLDSYRLPLLAERLGLPTESCQRALADADRVRLLWMTLKRNG